MRSTPNCRWMLLHTIATTADGKGFFGSGLCAVVDGKDAGIISYENDSYYGFEIGTELEWNDEYTECGYNWMWEGTAEELFYAANHCTDLMFPDRALNQQDSDYQEMMDLYTKIRGYLRKQARKLAKKKKRHQSTGADKIFVDSTVPELDDGE